MPRTAWWIMFLTMTAALVIRDIHERNAGLWLGQAPLEVFVLDAGLALTWWSLLALAAYRRWSRR